MRLSKICFNGLLAIVTFSCDLGCKNYVSQHWATSLLIEVRYHVEYGNMNVDTLIECVKELAVSSGDQYQYVTRPV